MRISKTRVGVVTGLVAALVFIIRDSFFVTPLPAPSPPSSAIQSNDMLNVADIANGELIAKTCTACHSFEEGGPNKVGPNLFGIVGARVAQNDSFQYSEAFIKLRQTQQIWTTDALYEWLRDPSGFAPGSKMSFGGLLDPQDRMDLIAYLITLR